MAITMFKFVNTISFVGMVAINALAVLLPINGMDTGRISDLYPSLFTPAGFTFGIWSVIYFWLFTFVVAQWFYDAKPYYENLSRLFILSCIANMTWIIAWHYLLPGVALMIMLILLVVLIRIFLLIREHALSVKEKILFQLPFHVYLGWISVATIANTAAVLVNWHWGGALLSQQVWTIILLVIAALLSLLMLLPFSAVFYSLVTVWALYGIFARWRGVVSNTIGEVAFYLMLILLFAIAVSIFVQLINFRSRSSV
jgi:hypothetical protein